MHSRCGTRYAAAALGHPLLVRNMFVQADSREGKVGGKDDMAVPGIGAMLGGSNDGPALRALLRYRANGRTAENKYNVSQLRVDVASVGQAGAVKVQWCKPFAQQASVHASTCSRCCRLLL